MNGTTIRVLGAALLAIAGIAIYVAFDEDVGVRLARQGYLDAQNVVDFLDRQRYCLMIAQVSAAIGLLMFPLSAIIDRLPEPPKTKDAANSDG